MSAGLFGHINQGPYLIKSLGCRNLKSDVLSCLHSMQSDWNMAVPVGADVYYVHVRALAKLSPCLMRTGKLTDVTRIAKSLKTSFDCSGIDVAKSSYPAIRNT